MFQHWILECAMFSRATFSVYETKTGVFSRIPRKIYIFFQIVLAHTVCLVFALIGQYVCDLSFDRAKN